MGHLYREVTPAEVSECHRRGFKEGTCVRLRRIHHPGYGLLPLGSHLFTDLTHYVRTGDFVIAMIRDSRTIDEYGFALGALAHYAADNNGHSIAINRAVPLLYPKLRRKYGDEVTYGRSGRTPENRIRLRCAAGRQGPLRFRLLPGIHRL